MADTSSSVAKVSCCEMGLFKFVAVLTYVDILIGIVIRLVFLRDWRDIVSW